VKCRSAIDVIAAVYGSASGSGRWRCHCRWQRRPVWRTAASRHYSVRTAAPMLLNNHILSMLSVRPRPTSHGYVKMSSISHAQATAWFGALATNAKAPDDLAARIKRSPPPNVMMPAANCVESGTLMIQSRIEQAGVTIRRAGSVPKGLPSTAQAFCGLSHLQYRPSVTSQERDVVNG
jgi:hypothetical protein